jgi:hypothetical protein
VNGDLEKILKDAAVTQLSNTQDLPGGTAENHTNPQKY